MKAIKINITLTDGTLLPFEASGLNYKTAEELATLLKTQLGLTNETCPPDRCTL